MKYTRVGTKTALLIVFATAAALFAEFFGMNGVYWLYRGWAVFLIVLGLEFLLTRQREENERFTLAWGSLITAVAASFVAVMLFSGWTLFHADDGREQVRSASRSNTLELDLSPDITKIHIQNRNANIELQPIAGDQVLVTVERRNSRWLPFEVRTPISTLEVEERDGTLYVENKNERIGIGPVRIRTSSDLVVHLPQSRPLDVEVEQRNGAVQAQSLPLYKTFHAQTTNGKIHVSDMEGEVRLQSTNGSIRAHSIDGKLDVRTTNGKVEVEGSSLNSLNVKTTNRGVRLNDTQIEGDWDLSTTNGKLDLRLPKDADFRLTARTTNGSIDVDEPLVSNRKRAEGTVGDGTHRISASTTNRNISIRLE